jgi:hypothetical protein
MLKITFNGQTQDIQSIEDLSLALVEFNKSDRLELWLSKEEGPSICLLKNGPHAFLMYSMEPGDSGFVTKGESNEGNNIKYFLSNGQEDSYPESWCVSLEDCQKAITYFYVNDGLRPDWISWQEG